LSLLGELSGVSTQPNAEVAGWALQMELQVSVFGLDMVDLECQSVGDESGPVLKQLAQRLLELVWVELVGGVDAGRLQLGKGEGGIAVDDPGGAGCLQQA
jgi:hypothetical protein